MGRVIFFGEGEGDRLLQGGKGAGLDNLMREGHNVPAGFTISTTAYHNWRENGFTSSLEHDIDMALNSLEKRTGRKLGSPDAPLLVSVRSGAPESMPGMMSTVLNVGLTESVIDGLAQRHGAEFAYNTTYEFVRGYCGAVHNFELTKSTAEAWIQETVRPPGEMERLWHLAGQSLGLQRIYCELENDVAAGHSASDIREALEEDLVMRLYGKEKIFKHIIAGTRITGMPVRLESTGSFSDGEISLLTEDYIEVETSTGIKRIPYTQLENTILDISPYFLRYADQYVAELQTLGDPLQDARRLLKTCYSKLCLEENPAEQVMACTRAVFHSWGSSKARAYREEKGISNHIGTAANVVQMVFGNLGPKSGTAVFYTSCPRTGKAGIKGEFLQGRQGDSLVSGDVTPVDIIHLQKTQPKIYASIESLARRLEKRNGEIQEVEITWEDGNRKPYVLQTRDAKMTPRGRIGYSLRRYAEGKTNERELFRRIAPEDLESLTTSVALDTEGKKPLAEGIPVVEGVVTGKIATRKNDFTEGEPIIYCRTSATTSDIEGIRDCAGFVTATGGAMSHAAVVATDLGKPTIVGCEGIEIESTGIRIGDKDIKTGEVITIDGRTGKIYEGAIPTKKGRESKDVKRLIGIAKEFLGDLPHYYRLQTLECASLIKDKKNPNLIYTIDFDCLLATGKLDGKSYSNNQIAGNLETMAQAAYTSLHKMTQGEILLNVSGDYDSEITDTLGYAMNVHLQNGWIRAYAEQAEKKDDQVLVLLGRGAVPSMKYIPISQNVTFTQQHRNGKDCIVINPWAEEESYLLAAREGVCHE